MMVWKASSFFCSKVSIETRSIRIRQLKHPFFLTKEIIIKKYLGIP